MKSSIPPMRLVSSPSVCFLPNNFENMLIVFLNYIVFLSAKIAIKTETFLIKILLFYYLSFLLNG